MSGSLIHWQPYWGKSSSWYQNELRKAQGLIIGIIIARDLSYTIIYKIKDFPV
jgi:hypothetical protein